VLVRVVAVNVWDSDGRIMGNDPNACVTAIKDRITKGRTMGETVAKISRVIEAIGWGYIALLTIKVHVWPLFLIVFGWYAIERLRASIRIY
jgi:hypothetical protein